MSVWNVFVCLQFIDDEAEEDSEIDDDDDDGKRIVLMLVRLCAVLCMFASSVCM